MMSKKIFQFKSIKTSLLTKIGLVAIVPLLMISFFNFRYYRADSMQSAADIQSLVNQNTATKIHLYIIAQQLIFMEFSKSSPHISTKDTDEVIQQKFLSYLSKMTSLSFYETLFVCDQDGTIIAHTSKSNEPNLLGKQILDFDFGPAYYTSNFKMHSAGPYNWRGQYSVMPLIKSLARNKYYLVGATNLETLLVFMKEELAILESKNYNEGTLLLIDKSSQEIVQVFSKQDAYPTTADWESLSQNQNKIMLENRIWYADKEDILIGSNIYYLSTLVTENDILFNSSRMLFITLAIVASALLVMVITIILIAKSFVKPLKQIGENMKKVAKGYYKGRLEVLSQDEFGQLAASANQMTLDLKKADEKIKKQLIEINTEKERSDHLLLNILPPSIAERLKKDEATIADFFPDATILFSDLVGFTQFSSEHSAKDVVDALNKLYSVFDDLLDKHQVEKIKTIGDALLLVSGIPDPIENHAHRMTHMAIDMMRSVEQFNKANNTQFKIRIGIHTGPVVAGVIGKKKFVYDIWGDSVNVASRMESNSLPDHIQVSQASYELIKDVFTLVPRGKIDIKGKGMMQTYFLVLP